MEVLCALARWHPVRVLNSRHLLPVLLVAAVAACSNSSPSDADSADTTAPVTTEATPERSVPEATAAPATTAPPATTEPPTTTAAPTTTAPEPAEWEPVGDAPYSVGVATVTIDDPEGVRPLTVDVWFPIDDGVDPATLMPQRYTLLPGLYYESPDAFAAAADQIETDATVPVDRVLTRQQRASVHRRLVHRGTRQPRLRGGRRRPHRQHHDRLHRRNQDAERRSRSRPAGRRAAADRCVRRSLGSGHRGVRRSGRRRSGRRHGTLGGWVHVARHDHRLRQRAR